MDIFFRPRISSLPEHIAVKWSPGVLNEGFVPFPKRLLRCVSKIFQGSSGMDEMRTVLAVVDFRRPGAKKPPSLDYLAFVAGMDVNEFRNRLDTVRSKGLIVTRELDDRLEVEIEPLLERIMQESEKE